MVTERQAGHDSTGGAVQNNSGRGCCRFVTSTNHKDIGTMYFVFSIVAILIGVFLSVTMQVEPTRQDTQILGDPSAFNFLAPGYSLIMAFYTLIPGLVGGFGSWFVPLMIGARDMAFPRMHSITFWLLPFSFGLLVLALFSEGVTSGAGTGSGFTIYKPSLTASDLAIVALFIAGASQILSSINFITTIVNMRAPGTTLHKMPIFVWSILGTTILLLLWLSVFAGAITMLFTDPSTRIDFVRLSGGVEPAVNQSVFWLLAYPEVYALMLPSIGIISQVVSTFAKRPVFGQLAIAYALVAISFSNLLVWTNHLYVGNLFTPAKPCFIIAAMIVLTMGTAIFSWLVTIWRGTVTFRTPMIWAIGFVFCFLVHGAAGAVLSRAGADASPQHIYDVEAQFFFVLSTGAIFAFFAGWYYWFPKFTGLLYNETLGILHFGATFVGVNLDFFTPRFSDAEGILRHSLDFPEPYAIWKQPGSVGSYIVVIGLAIFLLCMMNARIRGTVSGPNPWKASTPEWTRS